MEKLQFIESQRGNNILLHSGQKYSIKKRNKNGTILWACVNRKNCSGSITTKK